MTRHDSPSPRLLHLYPLLIGVVAGVLLGPAVLGRVSPETYRSLFQGGRDAAAEVLEYQRETTQKEEALRNIFGMSGGQDSSVDAALSSLRLNRGGGEADLRLAVTEAENRRLAAVRGWMIGLILAVAGVMVVESVVDPSITKKRADAPPDSDAPPEGEEATESNQPTAVFAALVTARYLLLAMWIAIAFAQPAVLSGPWQAVGGLAVVGVAIVVAVGVAARGWRGDPATREASST